MDVERAVIEAETVGTVTACCEVVVEPSDGGARQGRGADRLKESFEDLTRAVESLTETIRVFRTTLAALGEEHACPSRLDTGEHASLSVPSGTHAPRAGALPHGSTR